MHIQGSCVGDIFTDTQYAPVISTFAALPRAVINCLLLIDNIARIFFYDLLYLFQQTTEYFRLSKLYQNEAQLNLIECVRSAIQLFPLFGNFFLIHIAEDCFDPWETHCLSQVQGLN